MAGRTVIWKLGGAPADAPFLRFAIDAVFVKRQEDGESWRVEKAAQGLRPWLGVSVCGTADAVIELRRGEAERIGMTPGSVWEEVRRGV